MTSTARSLSRRTLAALLVVRTLAAAGLLVDAAVHLHLAPGYQESAPQGIGAGALFILQAVTAVIVAAYVLVRGTPRSYAAALLVSGSALLAVVVYRYVNIPAIGPFPGMYEPVWFLEKSVSAVAEAVAGLAAVVGIWLLQRPSSVRGALRS